MNRVLLFFALLISTGAAAQPIGSENALSRILGRFQVTKVAKFLDSVKLNKVPAGSTSGQDRVLVHRAPGDSVIRSLPITAFMLADDVLSAQGATAFNNIDSLMLHEGTVGQYSRTLGYYTPGDDGGAFYRWDATSTTAHNGRTIYDPLTLGDAGRWVYMPRDGVINLNEIGVSETAPDNAERINAVFDEVPPNTQAKFTNAPGIYPIDTTIVLVDRRIIWDGHGAYFQFPAGVVGLWINSNDVPIDGVVIKNMLIQALAKAPWDGYANMTFGLLSARPSSTTTGHWYYATDNGTFYQYNGSAWASGTPVKSASEANYNYDGIFFGAVTQFDNVRCYGFSGMRMVGYGEIGNKYWGTAGPNISGSRINNCVMASNSLHGVWMVGPDANACLTTTLDVRDNGGYGVKDQSFLGNKWINVMAHYNGLGNYVDSFGDFWCTYPTTRSSFDGCYSESRPDNRPALFHGGVIVSSSLMGGGLSGGQSWSVYGIERTHIVTPLLLNPFVGYTASIYADSLNGHRNFWFTDTGGAIITRPMLDTALRRISFADYYTKLQTDSFVDQHKFVRRRTTTANDSVEVTTTRVGIGQNLTALMRYRYADSAGSGGPYYPSENLVSAVKDGVRINISKGHPTASKTVTFTVDTNGASYTEAGATGGIEYAADYSAGYTNRSLVDKEYVDDAVAAAGGAETDPVYSASAASGITSGLITQWNSAYGWGNHASAGYLTSYTETDPLALKITNNLSDLGNAGTARTNLGATTLGANIFTAANPSAVRWIRVNADNTVSFRTASETAGDIGALTSYTETDPTALKISSNLSDLANAATARTNLGAQAQLNGTGFVKANGTSVTYDNSTYLTGNQTVTLTGDVTGSGATSIATTIANDVVSNTKLTDMDSKTIKANVTGSAGDPTDASLTSILDFLSQTQGAIIYRGSSVWQALPPGSTGSTFLKNDGAGGLSWASVGGGAGFWTASSVTTNQNVTNALTAITGLSFSITSGKTYHVKAVVIYTGGSGAIYGSSGTPTNFNMIVTRSTSSNSVSVESDPGNGVVMPTTTDQKMIVMDIHFTAASTGTWFLPMENDAGTVNVKAGSYLEYHEF